MALFVAILPSSTSRFCNQFLWLTSHLLREYQVWSRDQQPTKRVLKLVKFKSPFLDLYPIQWLRIPFERKLMSSTNRFIVPYTRSGRLEAQTAHFNFLEVCSATPGLLPWLGFLPLIQPSWLHGGYVILAAYDARTLLPRSISLFFWKLFIYTDECDRWIF